MLGGFVEVEVGLLKEQSQYVRRTMQDSELERGVVVDGPCGGIGSLDEQKGNDF